MKFLKQFKSRMTQEKGERRYSRERQRHKLKPGGKNCRELKPMDRRRQAVVDEECQITKHYTSVRFNRMNMLVF